MVISLTCFLYVNNEHEPKDIIIITFNASDAHAPMVQGMRRGHLYVLKNHCIMQRFELGFALRSAGLRSPTGDGDRS